MNSTTALGPPRITVRIATHGVGERRGRRVGVEDSAGLVRISTVTRQRGYRTESTQSAVNGWLAFVSA